MPLSCFRLCVFEITFLETEGFLSLIQMKSRVWGATVSDFIWLGLFPACSDGLISNKARTEYVANKRNVIVRQEWSEDLYPRGSGPIVTPTLFISEIPGYLYEVSAERPLNQWSSKFYSQRFCLHHLLISFLSFSL